MMAGPSLVYVIAGSTLVDAVAGAWVLFARRPEGSVVGLRRVVGAAAAAVASFLIKLPLLWVLRVGFFGWIHLAYVDLVVLVPVLGALLWLAASPIARGRARLRLSPGAQVAATVAVAMAGVGYDATFIEPYRLRLESDALEISGRRAGHSPVRIGVIADIQTDRVTEHERRAIAALMAERPDVILIAGDVFQGTPEQFLATRSDLHDLLARLAAPGGVFLVLGDVDGDGYYVREVIEGTGIRLLVNETETVSVGDRRLTIGGVELDYTSPSARGMVGRMESTPGDEDIRIVLAHRPDVVLGLRRGSRVDLVVAGHTHGGQVVIPGFGPPLTLSRVPRSVAAGGLHEVDGNAIYVGRGVGHERGQAPRVRFFCPPEVAVVEIGEQGRVGGSWAVPRAQDGKHRPKASSKRGEPASKGVIRAPAGHRPGRGGPSS